MITSFKISNYIEKLNYYFVVVFFVFLSRIIFFLFFFDSNRTIVGDEWEYIEVGKNILIGEGFWNPERGGELYFSEPIFPIMIALSYLIFNSKIAIIIINILLTIVLILLYCDLMRRNNFNNIMIIFFGIFLSLHPYLCYYNFTFLAESLKVFSLSILVYVFCIA